MLALELAEMMIHNEDEIRVMLNDTISEQLRLSKCRAKCPAFTVYHIVYMPSK
jgi:hypothetical protein